MNVADLESSSLLVLQGKGEDCAHDCAGCMS